MPMVYAGSMPHSDWLDLLKLLYEEEGYRTGLKLLIGLVRGLFKEF
jgi:hypothetical protein